MKKRGNSKHILIAAAWWNWLAALGFLLAGTRLQTSLGINASLESLNAHLAIICITLWGIGYYWAAKDFSRNESLVKLGVIGKVGVFLLFLGHAWAQHIPFALVTPAVIDLIFAGLFLGLIFRARVKSVAD